MYDYILILLKSIIKILKKTIIYKLAINLLTSINIFIKNIIFLYFYLDHFRFLIITVILIFMYDCRIYFTFFRNM